jgi:amino acid transporter
MSAGRGTAKANFGTAPVFLTAISTILGAILFLRFGYAVGHLGFVGTLAVIALGHLVTIPTAMAIAEIATNQRVEGGGVYFIVSRSFGILVGAAIGLALYLSQAISVSFYVIAFAEAFGPVFDYLRDSYGIVLTDKHLVSIPTIGLLALLMITKGANIGVKALYVVVGTLFLSLALFFLGSPLPLHSTAAHPLFATVQRPDSFFLVFAICFPAFTGMAAGVGLSGDLRDPKRSIPLGTLAATFCGMAIYICTALKLALSATPEDLASDQLIMSRIALWGPIIPIGLACATLSSALGSVLIAPRTLQAIAADEIFPLPSVNRWLAKGRAGTNEPVRASLITSLIALFFVVIGNVDFVAQIISMFFMVTYGAICLVSFLEHFAADPSYRPVFRSRWYVSLFGAAMCVWLMFEMSAAYAALAVVLTAVAYAVISSSNPDRRGLATIFQDAIFQISRQLHVFLQQSTRQEQRDNWRPAVVCISSNSFERLAAFDLLRWIAHRYGFGTYIHYIEGYLSAATHADAQNTLQRLVRMANVSEGNIYVDTLVSPSYTTAISQLIQIPGISGKENNMILLEFSKSRPEALKRIIDNYQLIVATDFDICILGSSERGFGYHREIHIWLTSSDYENAGLMILLAYVILGHPDWRNGIIKIFAIFPERELEEQEERLLALIKSGRLPISVKNIEFIAQSPDRDRKTIINERSVDADLTILGFQGFVLKRQKEKLFNGFEQIGNVLFVNATHEIDIVEPEEAVVEGGEEGEPTPSTESAAESAEPPCDPDASKTSRG